MSSSMLRCRDDLLGELLAALVARLARPRRASVVERGALLFDHLAQLLGDVVVDAAEVVAARASPRAAARSFSSISRMPCDALAVAVLEALLHHPAQRRVEVAVVEQVVGDLVHDVVGIELEADLGAVPRGVPEPGSTRMRGRGIVPRLGNPPATRVAKAAQRSRQQLCGPAASAKSGRAERSHVTSGPARGTWARPPTASLLRRLDRCRPSRTNSTAEATDAGRGRLPDELGDRPPAATAPLDDRLGVVGAERRPRRSRSGRARRRRRRPAARFSGLTALAEAPSGSRCGGGGRGSGPRGRPRASRSRSCRRSTPARASRSHDPGHDVVLAATQGPAGGVGDQDLRSWPPTGAPTHRSAG